MAKVRDLRGKHKNNRIEKYVGKSRNVEDKIRVGVEFHIAGHKVALLYRQKLVSDDCILFTRMCNGINIPTSSKTSVCGSEGEK